MLPALLAVLLLAVQPGLDHSLKIPRHWNVVRGERTVSATSPDADALLQLSIPQAASLEAASSAFFSEEGVKAERSWKSPIHHRSALWSRFRVREGKDEVRGFVVFVADRGRVFQIVAVADVAVFRKYEEVLKGAIESFAPSPDLK